MNQEQDIMCKFSLSCGNNNILSGITGYSTYLKVGIKVDNSIVPIVDKEYILNIFLGQLLNDLEKFPELFNIVNKDFNIHLHDEIEDICNNALNNAEYVVWICDHKH